MDKNFTGVENGKFYADGKEIGYVEGQYITITDEETIQATLKDMEK